MKRRLIGISLTAFLSIGVGLAFLLNSQTGSRWLLEKVFALPAVSVSTEQIDGTLLDRLTFKKLIYQKEAVTVKIDHLVLAWQPSALLHGRIRIRDLMLDGVDITLGEAEKKSETAFKWDQGYRLPLQLTLENLAVTAVALHQNGGTRLINKIQLSAATEGDTVNIRLFSAKTPEADASLRGSIGLGPTLPVKLSALWQADLEKNGSWRGTTALYGSAEKLNFTNQISSPFKGGVQGYMTGLLDKPAIKAVAAWQALAWPFAGSEPQIASRYGAVAVVGPFSDYRVLADTCLRRGDLPEACLLLDGTGSLDAFAIALARLTSSAGRLSVKGDVDWGQKSMFALTVEGRNFNPGIFLPQLPGALTFNTKLNGKLDFTQLELSVDINEMSGKLRDYQVSGGGHLKVVDKKVNANALTLALGPNKIVVDGMLGQQQSALALTLNLPKLAALWPGLQGQLTGKGRLAGAMMNPAIDFTANGRHMGYAGTQAAALTLAIDYQPTAAQASTIKLTAQDIKSGETRISRFLLNGQGTPEKHRVELVVNANQGNVSALLQGNYREPLWQGTLTQLDIVTGPAGKWQLNKPLALRFVQKKPAGFDVTASSSCLVQQNSKLCLQGRYAAKGDFDGAFNLNQFPTALVQPLLPKNVRSDAVLSGEGEVKRRNNRLAGTYRLALGASTLTVNTRGFRLGASSINGAIKDTTIVNRLDLALAGQDYIRGQIRLNTGKAGVINGQIAAKIDEMEPIRAFIPQLSQLQGHVSADLTVKGALAKPTITGVLDVADGLVETDFISMKAINLHARALAGDRIIVDSSARPQRLKLQGKEPLSLQATVHINAELQRQQNGFRGAYRLQIPAPLVLATSRHEERLGALMVTGDIKGPMLTADLAMALHDQDYLRAAVTLDTADQRIRAGHVTASITNFKFVEVLVSQLTQVKGRLTADITLAGPFQSPQMAGTIRLDQASLQAPDTGVALTNMSFQILARPGEMELAGFAKSGEGYINLNGKSHWQQGGLSAHVTAAGDNFQVAKLPELQAAVSPKLDVDYENGNTRVDGIVKIPSANLEIQEFPENAIKVSKDEIVVGETEPEQQQPTIGAAVNVEIVLGKAISFKGMGLKSNLSGSLKLASKDDWLSAFGTLELINATYKSYGQDLTVRKGRFTFNGPTDNPWLDIEATRMSKNKDITAVLSLTGPLSEPKTKIYTEPSLPETEALAYLITGNSLSQLSKSEGNKVASAALSYGAGQMAWLTDKMGLENFAVEQGTTFQDTLVTAGRYLTPDFYIGTKVGFFNKQALLIMKRKLTERINVETQTGTSQRIKLNYEFDNP